MSKLNELIENAIAAIGRLRREGARVHCITNSVAQNFIANVLLSCGATPSMTVSPKEVEYFTARSDALLINLGTLSESRKAACLTAVDIARKNQIPFVLDPVMCNVSPPRLDFAKLILSKSPAIVRVNAQEADIFLPHKGLSAPNSCRVISGKTDRLIFKDRRISVSNGDPLMAKLIAVGCAQGAVMAALASKTDDYIDAALGALLWFGVSGEIAASKCDGPGSFHAAFIDSLYEIPLNKIAERARVAL